jgi:hypothetical protein
VLIEWACNGVLAYPSTGIQDLKFHKVFSHLRATANILIASVLQFPLFEFVNAKTVSGGSLFIPCLHLHFHRYKAL